MTVELMPPHVESPSLRVLSQSEYRIEGRDKVTGTAEYVADVRLEGMLDVAYVRSPHPHARIVSIDVAAAMAMPGVHRVLTGDDVKPARLGRTLQDWPLLVWDRARLIGDRVVAVAAESFAQAQAAADLIEVEYEPLPGVFDPRQAIAPGTPLLHPDSSEYQFLRGERHATSHPNLQGEGRHEHGDVDAGFAASAHVFEHTFETARTYHGHLEPHVSVVWMDGAIYHVRSTNKAPFRLRGQLAASLGIPVEQIVVDAHFIGGDFGGKGFSIDEYLLMVLARETGRPVRYTTTLTDDLCAGNCRHRSRITLRTGVDASGRILAHDALLEFDGGAYAAAKGNAALMPGGGLHLLVGYRVPAARARATCAYTNTVPAGHARAPGQPQASFASESHVDLIARGIGMDPLEFRRLNAMQVGEADGKGKHWKDSTMSMVLDRLGEEVCWHEPPAAGRGRGVSLGARSSPEGRGGPEMQGELICTVAADGCVDIITGVADQGAGAHTMVQRIFAEELGVSIERVRVHHGTTAEAHFDTGAGGSRITPVVGGAAQAGAGDLKTALDALAPGMTVLDQLGIAGERGGVRVDAVFNHEPGLHCTYAYAVEVEVDPETGTFSIIDCVFVADVGTVINPLALRGQLVGGFVSGLGQTVMEDLAIDDGVVLTPNLGEYKMPTMPDVPPLRVVLLTDVPGGGPFGAKSAGELANVAIAPAIANAIHDAVGVRISSLPITPEKILAALRTNEARRAQHHGEE